LVPASNLWVCDLSSSTADAEVTIVQGYGTAGYEYSAWGHENDGEEPVDYFCCHADDGDIPAGGITDIKAIGGTGGDLLSFTWDSATYNLDSAGYRVVNGWIEGGLGNDVIHGSDADNANYSETLNGKAGRDTIHGNDGDDALIGEDGVDSLNGNGGDDYMTGNDDDDNMYGGDGADTMYGGDGADVMTGGDGDDTMYGGNHRDRMSGEGDNDYMDGGLLGDIMCGGDDEDDYVFDGDGTAESGSLWDQIWGKNAAAEVECGDTSTRWDGVTEDNNTCGIWTLLLEPNCP